MSVLKQAPARIAALALLVLLGVALFFLRGSPGDDPEREPGAPAAVQLDASGGPTNDRSGNCRWIQRDEPVPPLA